MFEGIYITECQALWLQNNLGGRKNDGGVIQVWNKTFLLEDLIDYKTLFCSSSVLQ